MHSAGSSPASQNEKFMEMGSERVGAGGTDGKIAWAGNECFTAVIVVTVQSAHKV